METLSALLALCEGNPSVIGGFPVMQSFDVSFHVSMNKQLNKQSRDRWIKLSWCSYGVAVMNLVYNPWIWYMYFIDTHILYSTLCCDTTNLQHTIKQPHHIVILFFQKLTIIFYCPASFNKHRRNTIHLFFSIKSNNKQPMSNIYCPRTCCGVYTIH